MKFLIGFITFVAVANVGSRIINADLHKESKALVAVALAECK